MVADVQRLELALAERSPETVNNLRLREARQKGRETSGHTTVHVTRNGVVSAKGAISRPVAVSRLPHARPRQTCYMAVVHRQRPLLVPARTDAPCVHVHFDEQLIAAQARDSLATALISAGVLMTSRSAKYRRPRGAYCLSGDCGTCLVRVDGRPNVRACMTPVHEGLRAHAQNTYQPASLDPTQLVDHLFPGGLDHHHMFVRPRIVNQVMQEVARNLTGFGELPEGVAEREHDHVEQTLDVLIIGAGPAGRAAAAVLESAGVEHRIVDRYAAIQLDANATGATPKQLLTNTAVFGIYPSPQHALPGHASDLALVAASEVRDQHERVWTFRPRHLLLCTGSRDPMLPFPNNDLPGIVAARGLVRALRRADARIAGPCVVVGEGDWAQHLCDELDSLRSDDAPKIPLVAPEQIERAVGRERIEALMCRSGRISCALLAVASTPAPAHELPSQAGAPLRFDGQGFAVVRDADHGCGWLGGTRLWAAGDVCGWLGSQAAARDGENVGKSLLAALAPQETSA
jgi:sarcosine oxidase subunit alpha